VSSASISRFWGEENIAVICTMSCGDNLKELPLSARMWQQRDGRDSF
jgi:hypothetical protein